MLIAGFLFTHLSDLKKHVENRIISELPIKSQQRVKIAWPESDILALISNDAWVKL